MSVVPSVTLNNGVKMPMLGFGVFQIPDMAQCEQAVVDALQAGYRLIDTAAAYMNEEAVGKAIKRSGVPREEIFVVTKLWIQDQGYENTKKAFQKSLDNLGLDYVDLYLIHQPIGDYYGSWRAMEEFCKAGKARAIGVSNFPPDRLVDLLLHNEIKPAVNQIELHPFFQQAHAMPVLKEYGVQAMSWGPFAEGRDGIFTNETLVNIAKAHGKTTAQVILRFLTQEGAIVIPKSVHKERIVQNFQVFDFELSDDELSEIRKMDRGASDIIHHTDPSTVKWLSGMKIHE